MTTPLEQWKLDPVNTNLGELAQQNWVIDYHSYNEAFGGWVDGENLSYKLCAYHFQGAWEVVIEYRSISRRNYYSFDEKCVARVNNNDQCQSDFRSSNTVYFPNVMKSWKQLAHIAQLQLLTYQALQILFADKAFWTPLHKPGKNTALMTADLGKKTERSIYKLIHWNPEALGIRDVQLNGETFQNACDADKELDQRNFDWLKYAGGLGYFNGNRLREMPCVTKQWCDDKGPTAYCDKPEYHCNTDNDHKDILRWEGDNFLTNIKTRLQNPGRKLNWNWYGMVYNYNGVAAKMSGKETATLDPATLLRSKP